MDKYKTFLKTIAEKGLEEAFNLRSNELAAECALTPGAWVKPTIRMRVHAQP
ncbi:hypothetical protein L873DRAFT_1824469 [Choiromyces venosus 120613-1]|uniref:Uncharacterized protein n=1 Tax=Choiromyces venosus 120613-1 TaxID=1336337 RepID=A0A3N4ISV7_9PEZI|nr:hypothetical protein L873DRAFT_1824469 [Choiromyces venosus 120613-1]